eukprot:jgi/Antlo1/936/2452
MKALEKANTGWEQDQVIRITALYSAMHSFFEEKIKTACRNKISHQFLFPRGHGHKKYNAYKRQFSMLARTNKLDFERKAHKLEVSTGKRDINTSNVKIIELAYGDTFYSPIENVDDLRYSIAEVQGDVEEKCMLCKQMFSDVKTHYEKEMQKVETHSVQIQVCSFSRFSVSEQSISIGVRQGTRVGELKAAICRLLSIPTSRQQLSADGRILKNSEHAPLSDMILREKKK